MKKRLTAIIIASLVLAFSFSDIVSADNAAHNIHFENIPNLKKYLLNESDEILVDTNNDNISNVFDLIRLKKTVLNSTNPGTITDSGSDADGEIQELAFYTYEELVANGFCPEGYCSGTTARVYKVYESDGYWRYYVQVNFSGEMVPWDYTISPSGTIYSSNCSAFIVDFIYSGTSRSAVFYSERSSGGVII